MKIFIILNHRRRQFIFCTIFKDYYLLFCIRPVCFMIFNNLEYHVSSLYSDLYVRDL